MKNYRVFTQNIANQITNNFMSKNGYITKLTTNSNPKEVIGYIARCETPTKSDPDLVTIYVQWQESDKFTIHDTKILAMDRALKSAERYEKSLENFEFANELSTPTIEDAFPEDVQPYLEQYFETHISRSYKEVKEFARMCENKVNLFYKDKKKNIIWGNSVNFKTNNLNVKGD
ncbi:MAG: hypothetical protein J6J11_09335 [Treponema sp.]|nr:hypothetical protein [Clostridia bacterium]MBP3608502.1 hypothetical protein [Treponema sp.]